MKRSISMFVLLLCVAGAPAIAFAQPDAPPSAKDLEAAKKAFAAGRALHEKGKLIEAAEKFKESYRLSKNPVLLYNIGLTFEEAGMEDLALYYFRKFLTDAPQDAQQRPTVTERVKALEKKFAGGTTGGTGGTGGTGETGGTGGEVGTGTPPPKPDTTTKVTPTKPCSATDFQHQVVDAAPPSKPLDVTAFVPEDQLCVVTLHYRTAGEGKFTQKAMKWRYKELVARIPPTKMIGSAVQYFIEVKEGTNLIARSGKSTSPNQVLLEAGATPRFYPDVSDDGEAKTSSTDVVRSDDNDDPLSGKRTTPPNQGDIVVQPPVDGGPPGSGFRDVGSTKFTAAKWISTGAAGVGLGITVLSIIQGGKYASALQDDAASCGAPPCRKFDETSAGYESSGKTYNTLAKIGIGVGVSATVVAGYFWYKELRAKKRGEVKVSKAPSPDAASSWVILPAIGDGHAGAAAAVRF